MASTWPGCPETILSVLLDVFEAPIKYGGIVQARIMWSFEAASAPWLRGLARYTMLHLKN